MIYRDHAHDYLRTGWAGVLPLPPRSKFAPPAGYTGADGADPSPADVQTWAEDHPEANIALRLPPGVVGIDVDAYGDKPGAATLAELEAELGPLPPTVVSTSRSGGVSGIRLFRAPSRPSWRDPGPGVEIIHHGWRYLVAWPSIHPDGPTYSFISQVTKEILAGPPRPDDLRELPPRWVDHLSSDQASPSKADLGDGEVETWLATVIGGRPCARTRRELTGFHRALSSGASRHDATLKPVAALVRAGEAGCRGVPEALTEARAAFLAAVTKPGEGQRTEGQAADEWRRAVAGALQIVQADPTPEAHRGCRCVTVVGAPRRESAGNQAGADLDEIVDAARVYLDLPDPTPLLATLAVAATRDLDDEPVWLLLVGAPSGGKTEATRVLDDAADARLDDVSAAGLLSWKGGRKPAPVGVLTRIPAPNALVTFGDLSTLLASSDRGGRDQTFALLRKVYDGHVARDLGNAPHPLVWHGRLTVVAAVTDAIDNFAAHADALGPRWIYLRLPGRDTAGRRRAAAAARRGGLDNARDRLRTLASAAVRAAAGRVNSTDIGDTLAERIEDAALVCCWGRAAVPRHGYGRREIDGLPIIEEPPRVIRQLRGLARGALALGLDETYVAYLTRRAALDSMPAARRQTLDALADGERLTTSALSRSAGIDRHVVRRQLEELEAIGIVECSREGREPGDGEPDRRVATWQLAPEDAGLIAGVFHARHADDAAEVDRKVGTHPPTPPIKGRKGNGYVPTLRSTPNFQERTKHGGGNAA